MDGKRNREDQNVNFQETGSNEVTSPAWLRRH